MHYLGEEGFLRLAKTAMETTQKLMEAINGIPQLYVLGNPDATVFAFGGNQINIYELGAGLKKRGWHIETQYLPPSLHMTVSPVHAEVVDLFLSDLCKAVQDLLEIESRDISDQRAMYGTIGTLPEMKMAKDWVLQYLNDLYRIK
jgi:glutamate/tyrosine decarboxylase-like PLP-dependent enzyme